MSKFLENKNKNYNQRCKTNRNWLSIFLSALFGLLLLGACGESPTPVWPSPSPSAQPSQPSAISNDTVPTQNSITSAVAPPTIAPTSVTTTSPVSTVQEQIQVSPTIGSSPAQTGASARTFEHVFIIVLENADYNRAIAQPYLAELARQGAFLSNFYAETHPSYPNYLAMVAGSTFGITSDGQTDLAKTSLVDLMEAKGVNWKSYAEQYPLTPACFKGVSRNGYVRKHLPFLSFTNIQNDPTRCAKIVPASQLQQDLAGGKLPDYSLYVPDLNNDGHDSGVGYAAKWLQSFLTPLMKTAAFSQNTLVVITFDEGDSGTNNQIYTLLLGEPVKAGIRNNTKYNHYSLLRTIEDNFGLGNLGREDSKAAPITDIWNTR